MGQGNVYISCNYSCTISFLVKILLVKLKYLYIQYSWISIMKKQSSNQNVKVEKLVLLVKTFDHYHNKFQFFLPVLKFRSIFNHGYLHSAVWKALYNFKTERAQETKHNQFFFQNIQKNEIFEIFKLFKNNSWINFYYTKSKLPWTVYCVLNW